jgi:hypothetical protein
MIHHSLQLLPALDDSLRAVRRGDRLGLLQHPLRAARAIPVIVRGEVVGDADEPGAQRAAVGLTPRALEVAVGLQEGLLGDVLGVVVVADPVIGVGVDVAKVVAVEALEGAVELGLGLPVPSRTLLRFGHTASVARSTLMPPARRPPARVAPAPPA